jgi:hypothetical protein
MTRAAAARSSTRLFTQDTRYALLILTFFSRIAPTEAKVLTLSGPETCGETVAKSSDNSLA